MTAAAPWFSAVPAKTSVAKFEFAARRASGCFSFPAYYAIPTVFSCRIRSPASRPGQRAALSRKSHRYQRNQYQRLSQHAGRRARCRVKRFVYAASSSTYGDHPGLPKVEDKIGKPLSPYAVTKYVNELYADVFSRSYGLNTIGPALLQCLRPAPGSQWRLRCRDPKWIASMIKAEPIFINGDGETSRDFCFVENVRQINLLAATSEILKLSTRSTTSQSVIAPRSINCMNRFASTCCLATRICKM